MLETIQTLLLKYATSEAQLSQGTLNPQEHGNTVPLKDFLDKWSKAAGVPRIKDEVAESTSSPQPFYSDLLNSFKAEQSDGNDIYVSIEDETVKSSHKSKRKRKPTKKILETRDDSKNDADKSLKNSKRKRKVTKKALTKRPKVEENESAKTENRPYPCTLCDLSFLRKQHLERHFRVVHDKNEKEGEFACTDCQTVFYRQSKLDQHLLQVHIVACHLTKGSWLWWHEDR